MNNFGRTFTRGKPIGNDLRSLVVDSILSAGGDFSTGYFPGSFRSVGRTFKITGDAAKNIWTTFCQSGSLEPNSAKGQPLIFDQTDLDLVQVLKTTRPSMTYKELKEYIERYSAKSPSISAIGLAVRERLSAGKMTWKKMIRPSAEKFTPDNIAYCQLYIDFMNSVDPYRVKFFDETGVKVSDCANPSYGHSVKGTPCVEMSRTLQSRNVTLNALCGVNGLMYANTVDGASNTIEFLNFFQEASQNIQPNGMPVLEYGDFVVVDNVAFHRFEGGRILAQWMDTFGVTLIYLPVYSPELNPVELLFNKLKTILHRYEFRDILNFNVHVSMYRALQEITSQDTRNFYNHVEYLRRV